MLKLRVGLFAKTFEGGAGRAADRVLLSIQRVNREDGAFTGRIKVTGYSMRELASPAKLGTFLFFCTEFINQLLSGPRTKSHYASANLFSSIRVKRVTDGADLVNLHWLGNSFISILGLRKIQAPIVFTVHDEWLFRGTFHYSVSNKSGGLKLLLARLMDWVFFRLKKWSLKGKDIHVISPSNWLADIARRSQVGPIRSVSVIPYPIDSDVWFSEPMVDCRAFFGLPLDKKVIVAGSVKFLEDPRKGFDLLASALSLICESEANSMFEAGDIQLVLFGADEDPESISKIQCRSLGHMNDTNLRKLYSAADLVVVPSRIDNLPQVAQEAQACGSPVAAFKVGGLPDLVEDKISGFLAEPNNPRSLADAIIRALEHFSPGLRAGIVERATQKWDPHVIGRSYLELYEKLATANLEGKS